VTEPEALAWSTEGCSIAAALDVVGADGRAAAEGDRALPARLFAPPDPASHPSPEVSA
jgi:hypothetical protein